MKVLLLSGSIGQKSYTRTLLKYLDKQLTEKGIETCWWDLKDKPLPIAVPEYHNRPEENPAKVVLKFVQAVNGADGLILGTPLYHGSFSGVLKNALDNLPPDAFFNKLVGLVSHSSNARSCVRPCFDLRAVVGSLGGYPTRMQIGTTDKDFAEKSGDIILNSTKIKARATDLTEEMANILLFIRNNFYEAADNSN